jgi:hypothetical protein
MSIHAVPISVGLPELSSISVWHNKAACKGMDKLFFSMKFREAQKVCHSCPVLDECRNWGDQVETYGKPFGVLGGETGVERERRRKEEG